MRKLFQLAIPLFLFFFITSCSDAASYYEKGNYTLALTKLQHKTDMTNEDYLMKALCLNELGRKDESLQSLVYCLMSSEQSDDVRKQAVDLFLEVNDSDSLALFLLKKSDGPEAEKKLFTSLSKLGNIKEANEILEEIKLSMSYDNLITLLLDAQWDCEYISNVFANWLISENFNDKDQFAHLLCRFSQTQMTEETAKNMLALTDVIIGDEYYKENNIRLSEILKIKGNFLELLFDKVNARIYWNQALKLNPDDSELKSKVNNND